MTARRSAAATARRPAIRTGEDLHALARDWITLWQSELAALAVDREAQETWHALLSLWAGAAGAMIAGLPRGCADEPAGHGRTCRRARCCAAARARCCCT